MKYEDQNIEYMQSWKAEITSKEQLIKALADGFDSCFDQSYPVVDLTEQIVATVMDSAYSDPDVNDWLQGHQVVSIEPLSSHESYSIMERFALSRPDGQSQRLCDALSMKHPFRRFKDTVERMGLADEWYAWRGEAILRHAEELLEYYGVDFIDGRIVCTNKKNVHTYICERVE